jgi:hypothetical protein
MMSLKTPRILKFSTLTLNNQTRSFMDFTTELAECKSKASVEALWETHNITTYEDKIKALRESMGSPITFYLPGKAFDAASEYASELAIFLLGKWRIIELYKKAGIG